jgi:tetratricopeptide (TPR) repeat protein
MSLRTTKIDSPGKKVSLLAALLVLLAANYFFGKWALANMAASHADIVEAAELTEQWGPDDPQTHYAVAVLREKSFLPDDFARSLDEYSRATALSPNNYLYWLSLGNARARAGDLTEAEEALRVAEQLAPAYSSVQWALGNVLLRQEKMPEAFAGLRKAALADPQYAPAGANIAWQYFGGDVDRIRESVGDSPEIIGALIPLLISEKRTDEALSLWASIKGRKCEEQLKQLGKSLSNDLIAQKRFRDAASIEADICGSSSGEPNVGKINNGDFEGDIKAQATSPFEWTIADGMQPQIALTDGQKHGGGRSLLLIFNANGTSDFRQITQTIAVEPGKAFELSAFFKGDLKTSASIQWEIVAGSDGKVLAATSKVTPATEWTMLSAEFTVPEGTDGVILRLAKNGCGSTGCPVAGKVWFDDLVLTAK